MALDEMRELAREVLENKTRSHVQAATKLSRFVLEYQHPDAERIAWLDADPNRLEWVRAMLDNVSPGTHCGVRDAIDAGRAIWKPE